MVIGCIAICRLCALLVQTWFRHLDFKAKFDLLLAGVSPMAVAFWQYVARTYLFFSFCIFSSKNNNLSGKP
jgi:hypothetical protein